MSGTWTERDESETRKSMLAARKKPSIVDVERDAILAGLEGGSGQQVGDAPVAIGRARATRPLEAAHQPRQSDRDAGRRPA